MSERPPGGGDPNYGTNTEGSQHWRDGLPAPQIPSSQPLPRPITPPPTPPQHVYAPPPVVPHTDSMRPYAPPRPYVPPPQPPPVAPYRPPPPLPFSPQPPRPAFTVPPTFYRQPITPVSLGGMPQPSREPLLPPRRAPTAVNWGSIPSPPVELQPRSLAEIPSPPRGLADIPPPPVASDAHARHTGSKAKSADIRKLKARYEIDDYHPTTRIGGGYSVLYQPAFERVTITLRPYFKFVDGTGIVTPADIARALKSGTPVVGTGTDVWTAEDRARFVANFKGEADLWSHRFTFWCQEPGLEGNKATVEIEIEPVADPSAPGPPPPKTVWVGKNAWRSEVSQSGVTLTQSDEQFVLPLDLGRPGEGPRPGDLTLTPSAARDLKHPAIAHELGHVWGDGDEYTEAGTERKQGYPVAHSDAVKADFGHAIAYGWNDKSIMARGAEILPEHGVAFRQALELATGLSWSHTEKSQ
jgi:hypothetical protein